MKYIHALCALAALVPSAAFAFNGHRVTEGPLRLVIADVPAITAYDQPAAVTVTAKNLGKERLNVELEVAGLVDQWRPVGQTKRSLQLDPDAEAKAVFQIAAGEGAYSVHYPVHVYARFECEGRPRTAHAVQIFAPKFAAKDASERESTEMTPIVVPAHGAVSLYSSRLQRVSWRYYDQPIMYKPQGWQGSVAECRATFWKHGGVPRGTTKAAISMHPPWVPGGGTILADYLVKLPDTKPMKLTFANAIRTNTAEEPLSDGVTFRVWAGDAKLFERHTDSKTWVEGEADLSAYAGQQVLLRLESHPGPKRNTTCDGSYWAEPTIVTGRVPEQVTDAERDGMRQRVRGLIQQPRHAGKDEVVYWLGQGDDAPIFAAVLGKHGVLDGCIGFGRGDKCVTFDGLRVSVMGHPVGQWPSSVVQKGMRVSRGTSSTSFGHHLELDGEPMELLVSIRPEQPGLRIQVRFPDGLRRRVRAKKGGHPPNVRITDISLGPADQKAPRVYYGHGYCIVEPEAFRAGFGGHNLSTSHVGFDFEQGVSLLTACDTPPSYLAVEPTSRTYALHTHMNSTLTFVPSMSGALDAAIKYQPLYDKKPAGGVKRKAGRFVFDIWGGRYAEIAETMQQMVDYGLTDSLLTVHAWQRWGYDYRLPDIWPPEPRLGTVEDMRKISEVCGKHDIPWGLHDNYIDFYPDAADYTYDRICFTESGYPIKAWINEGRDAQSYRWRPDAFEPFMKRNLKLIKPAVAPTHYFIDVFTSIGCFDFYDKDGRFHPSTETRKCWGETFAWIRDYLGGNAPTTSEAGHDQLTGYLDGADCQHLQLTNNARPPGERYWFCIRLLHKDWERVPWFDAVLHDKFILHGVGYSGRYQGGRSRRDHGIGSDDYISAEILEGHALMTDSGGFGRGAVRKYWLAQDFIRSIALDNIERVQFADGDIHRQVVSWRSGGTVYVNRGAEDWEIAGKVLPQYGYFAKNGEIESSIERIDGIFAEQSRGPERLYVNARTYDADKRLPISPAADEVTYLGENQFKLRIQWKADAPAPKDLTAFVHFSGGKSKRSDRIAFQGDHRPPGGTSQWQGTVATEVVVGVPKEHGPGEYEIGVGLYDPDASRRYALRGDDDGSSRYRLGTLVVEGEGEKVTNIRLVKHKPKPGALAPPRLNLAKKPIDFGPVVTDGAFRLEVEPGKLVLTPLPDAPPFSAKLRLERIGGLARRAPKALRAVDRAGRQLRAVDFRRDGTVLEFRTGAGEFAYELLF